MEKSRPCDWRMQPLKEQKICKGLNMNASDDYVKKCALSWNPHVLDRWILSRIGSRWVDVKYSAKYWR